MCFLCVFYWRGAEHKDDDAGEDEDDAINGTYITISIITAVDVNRLTAGEVWTRPTGRRIVAGKGPTICRTHRAGKGRKQARAHARKYEKKKMK